MYSGTTLTPASGRILGAHQKVDRLARACLGRVLKPTYSFPTLKTILHFEGANGPDGLKRKSPAHDEPRHFYAPFDDTDTQLLDTITAHYNRLVAALKEKDDVRAGFEAAWLAHAVVDGLTPAHHFPYDEQLTELRRGGKSKSHSPIHRKLVMPGQTPRDQLRNNWKMWGPKGLLTSHGTFEWGVAILLAPLTSKRLDLTEKEFAELRQYGLIELFKRKAKEVGAFEMYEAYHRYGWTPQLAWDVRRRLIPVIVQTVTLAWYAAATEAAARKERA